MTGTTKCQCNECNCPNNVYDDSLFNTCHCCMNNLHHQYHYGDIK